MRRFLVVAIAVCTIPSTSKAFSIQAQRPPTLSKAIVFSSPRHLPTRTTASPCETKQVHEKRIAIAGLDRPFSSFSTALSVNSSNEEEEDVIFDGRTTMTLIGGQSLLVLLSVVLAVLLKSPNYGLGSNFVLNAATAQQGILGTLPLFGLAFALDFVEHRFQALQDVSRATQRSVLALLGTTFKPTIAIATSLALGIVAGIGEEMLFRGILQMEIVQRFGSTAVALTVTSIVFGALHAVTPLYAALAGIASVFFGYLYIVTDYNLAVPIVTHALYDVGALFYAHYTVTQMTREEQKDIWEGLPSSSSQP